MLLKILKYIQEFPGDTADENLPANAGHMGSVPGQGKFHLLGSK